MAKFTKTVIISSIAPISLQLQNAQIGQWFKCLETGIRGQYLGNSSTGEVVHWCKGKFNTKHAKGNKPLRQFAIINK